MKDTENAEDEITFRRQAEIQAYRKREDHEASAESRAQAGKEASQEEAPPVQVCPPEQGGFDHRQETPRHIDK